ncbi:MAG: tetratricopeptide repeat protein, partial [bacterium]
DVALRNLAVAERANVKDANIALLIASIYNANGYPEKAIPVYLEFLPAMERYRHDAEMFKRNYSSLLNEVATAYLKLGDAERARRFWEESLAVSPEQPGLADYLYPEGPTPETSRPGGAR